MTQDRKPRWLSSIEEKKEHLLSLISAGVPRKVLMTACGFTKGQMGSHAALVGVKFGQFTIATQESTRAALIAHGFSVKAVDTALRAYPKANAKAEARAAARKAKLGDGRQRGRRAEIVVINHLADTSPIAQLEAPSEDEVLRATMLAICAAADAKE